MTPARVVKISKLDVGRAIAPLTTIGEDDGISS